MKMQLPICYSHRERQSLRLKPHNDLTSYQLTKTYKAVSLAAKALYLLDPFLIYIGENGLICKNKRIQMPKR